MILMSPSRRIHLKYIGRFFLLFLLYRKGPGLADIPFIQAFFVLTGRMKVGFMELVRYEELKPSPYGFYLSPRWLYNISKLIIE
jgi:hypothetical protein